MIKEKLIKILSPITRNKYLFTIALFLIWITFLDRDSLIDRYDGIKQLNKIEQEKKKYQEQIDRDSENLQKLHNPEFLEKYAREEYLMKKDNEDLYIIFDDD